MMPYFKHFKIDGYDALALYRYDGIIKKLIFQFKGCKDYELRNVFLELFRIELKLRYFKYCLVPLPSSRKSDEERGFNHVIEIFKGLKLPFENVLFKKKEHKQSDGHFKDRIDVDKVIDIKNGGKLKGKNILIVDDICTTGSSIRAAIKLIQKYNPKRIKILVVAKRDFTEEELKIIGDGLPVLK